MGENKQIYGTVPINLLRNIHEDQKGTIRKMLNYAIYDRMRKNYPVCEPDDFEVSEMEESMIYFNLEPTDLVERLKISKELYDMFQGTPNASVNVNKLLEFQKGKTEFELMVFCFYCAIRSIIGTDAYYYSKTKKGEPDFWFVRAFGYSSKEDFKNPLPTQEPTSKEPTSKEKELRIKYSKRHWFDKVKLTLQNDWYLVYVSTNKHIKMRGYYVSISMTLEALAKVAKVANDKYKMKEMARKETLARVFNRDVPF